MKPVQLALALSAVSILMTAGELTSGERQEGVSQLERTRSGVVEATKGLSEAQWKDKPAPDRWSVAEVLEHIVVSEEALIEGAMKKALETPKVQGDRDVQSGDKLILKAIPDRSQKFKAPESMVPTGRWTPQETLARFLKTRSGTIDIMKNTAELRDHVLDSPLGQPLDAYQWLLFISAHSDRHTKQMLEVKADPGLLKQ